MSENARQTALEALIRVDGSVKDLVDALRAFSWNCEKPLVVLTPEDIIAILDRFLAGDLRSSDVIGWADALECREDVDYREPYAREIADALFRLATPEVNEPVTVELARALKDDLRKLPA